MFFTKVDSEVHSKSVKLDITFKNNSDHHGLFDLKAEVFEDVGDPIVSNPLSFFFNNSKLIKIF